MKKFILILLTTVMALPLLAGCAGQMTQDEMLALIDDEKIIARAEEILAQTQAAQPTETVPAPTAEPTDQPTIAPTLEPTPDPTAEPARLAPIDLLGEAFNPFYSVAFPEGYNPYGAIFDTGDPNKDGRPNYVLQMTAEGDTAEIVRFVSVLAGYDDEESITAYIDEIVRTEHVFIDGTANDKGMNLIAQAKKTVAGYDNNGVPDVDGCRLELTAFLEEDQIARYAAFIDDNLNLTMFGGTADSLAFGLDRKSFALSLNIYNGEETTLWTTYKIDNTTELRDQMAAELHYDWYNAGDNRMGITYGRIYTDVYFDPGQNQIFLNQKLNDAETASFDYRKPDQSLENLGFHFVPEDALATFDHKERGTSVSIHKPDWGARKDKWNLEFVRELNGSILVIWYVDAEQRYTIQADRGSQSAKYDYYIADDEFRDDYPDPETVQQIFKQVLGVPESEPYYYEAPLQILNEYLMETFGTTLDKLYALPLR
ncbi:MAG: PT domain-containing protein [Anaerolineaceae bacterium]|nr:PT domain-containing protein [Anaerolineaceae bacterium]